MTSPHKYLLEEARLLASRLKAHVELRWAKEASPKRRGYVMESPLHRSANRDAADKLLALADALEASEAEKERLRKVNHQDHQDNLAMVGNVVASYDPLKAQLNAVRQSLDKDRSGWTPEQWIEDAKEHFNGPDGSIVGLVNGHISYLLRALEAAEERYRRAVAAVVIADVENPVIQALQDQLQQTQARLEAAERVQKSDERTYVTGSRERWISSITPGRESPTAWVRVKCNSCPYVSEPIVSDAIADALWESHVARIHPAATPNRASLQDNNGRGDLRASEEFFE